MATITAAANGNYSAGATWTGGSVPGSADIADCAGYTVTVDQDVVAVQLKSTGAGYFSVTAARSITAAILSDTGHSGGGVVRCSHSTGTVTITGNVTAGPSRGVEVSGAGAVTVTGDVIGGSATNAWGFYMSGAAIATITGNVTGGSGAAAHGTFNNNNAATITITGNATGGSNGNTGCGARNAGTGTVAVLGVVMPGSSAAGYGLYGAVAGGTTTYRRAVLGGAPGATLLGYVKLAIDASVNYVRTVRSDTGADYDLSNDYPAEAQVESGVTYKLGTQTGTFVMDTGEKPWVSPWRGSVG